MVDRLRRIWPNFSLIEVLILIGIVAALSAALIPQLIGGGGDEGQKDSELSSVQNAIDSMMAELGLSSVAANDGAEAAAFRDWDSEEVPFGAGSVNLGPGRGGYFRSAESTWAYCWDGSGQITKQTDAGGDCG